MSRTFNELTPVTVTVVPKDATGAPFTPTNARYRVDDCRSENELVGWTALTPSEAIQITVPGSANAIVDDNLNKPEEKVITVHLDADEVTEQFAQYLYRVKNLRFAQAS